jgi:hypothetical protein
MKTRITLPFLTLVGLLLGAATANAVILQRGTATTGNNAGGATLTINKPTGVVAGDVMIATFASIYSSTPSAPSLSGWTSISTATFGGSAPKRGTVLYKVATGSEGASYAFTVTSGSTNVGGIVAFSGVSASGVGVNGTGTGPFDVAVPAIVASGSANNTATATALTTTTANAAVIMCAMAAYGTVTWPGWTTVSLGSLTEVLDYQNPGNINNLLGGPSVGAAWTWSRTAGSTGAGSATLLGTFGTPGGQWNGGILIALRPSGTPGNPSVIGTAMATASASSQQSILVTMPYSDDANANNTYTVDYKLSSSSTWVNWVTAAAHTTAPYSTTITGLTPGTSYDVRCTYNDADGVTGANPQIITGVTTTGLQLGVWSNLYHGSASPGSLTYAVPTGSGSQRVLVVAIASAQTATGNARTVTITYGGQTLTPVNGDMGTSTVQQHTALYYLNEAGLELATDATLSVAISGGTTRVTDVFAAVYDNVDQTTPIVNSRTYSSGTTAVSTFALGTGLTINAENQAIEIISSDRITSTSPRAVTTFATSWSYAIGQQWTTTDAVTNMVTTRAVPTANVSPADTTSTTMNGTSLGSMTALSLGIAKYTPGVIWPTASPITPGQALSASTLSGGLAPQAGGGTFAFTTPSTVPLHGNYSASVTFTPTYTTNNSVVGNVLVPVDTPPASGAHFLGATQNVALTITASTLAGLDYDADGDALTVTAVSSTSANGGAVSLSPANTITYTPAASFVGADQFTYTISDGYPGGTATCTAKVTVQLAKATSVITYISTTGGGTVDLRGYGVPGKSYDIQRCGTANFSTTISVVATVAAASNGIIIYQDTGAPNPSYYRFAVH